MPRTTLLLLVLAACQTSKPRSPYLRVTDDSGRLYFADQRTMLLSRAAGFLSFRDLVTNKSVRLQAGTYSTEEIPFTEVERWREKYMYHPSKLPHAEPDE